MTGREYARAWWLAHRNDELRIEAALAEAWEAGQVAGFQAARAIVDPALDALQAIDRRSRNRDIGE